MKVVFADQNLEDLVSPVIFLAGPTPRSTSVKSWRPEAIEYFEEANFDGTLLIPDNKDYDFIKQIQWEDDGHPLLKEING